jgi:E3 ubiquitin-protein ligase HERC4
MLSNLGTSNIGKSLPGKKVIQVAAGFSHSAVLTEDHKVYTWGKHENGQLGRENLNRKNKKQPKLVKLLDGHCVVQIACGNDHTMALTDDGQVFVWGSNEYGQLGLGEKIKTHQNVPEVIRCLKGVPVRQIVAGDNHSFILSKSGSLYGWGRNDFGQLGLGDTKNKYLPTKCRLANDQKIKFVSCGDNHTACLTKDGCVLTFGAGSNFQLGYCSNKNETSPKKVMELKGSEVSQIACGSGHTLAYAPEPGILYMFGQGGNRQFGKSGSESNSRLVSVSSPFVAGNESPLSYFCMRLDNQDPKLRIKRIHAGGSHSLVILVPANECDSDDFRKEEPATQILTFSDKKRFRNVQIDPDGKLSEEFLNDIGKVFSSASCLNGSFLLSNDEHYGTDSEKHGLDMKAVGTFFEEFPKTPDLLKLISTKIEEKLIPSLSTTSDDAELLRLYLILPQCPLFAQPEFYSSVSCQFVKSFLSLKESGAWKVFNSWWSSNQPSFFKKLVQACNQCLQYFLWLPLLEDTQEIVNRLQDLQNLAEMLQNLYQVNREKNIIDDLTFVVPHLKDKMNVQNEYPVVYLLQQSNQPMPTLLLCNYPFMFDTETKATLLQLDAQLQKQNMQRTVCIQRGDFLLGLPNLMQPNYQFPLNVDRKNLVNDALNKLRTGMCQNGQLLKLPLGVTFDGEKAGSEGVLKEFFRIFFREAMDPEFGLFSIDESSQFGWFNSLTQKKPEEFHMIGIMCGLTIYNSVAIDLHFPLAMYKKLLKKPVTRDDLVELRPELCKGLESLLNSDDVNFEDSYSLTFQWPPTGGTELCAGGADISVNQDNKNEYMDLVVDHLLNKSVKAQFDAFSEGFHQICGGKIMDSFRPEELGSLLEGNEEYDFLELEKNTSYAGVYYKRHETIILFWEVFHEMSLADKKKFLLFLTGSDRIPITGMKNIKITIVPSIVGYLPTSLTCYKQLLLPPYTTKEELKSDLLTAIQYTEGFHLTQN